MEHPIVRVLKQKANDLAKKREILLNMLVDSDSYFPCSVLGDMLIEEEKLLVKIATLAGLEKDYCDKAYGSIEEF